MRNFTTVETAWEEIPVETRSRLIVTGAVAVDLYLDRDTLDDQDAFVAYADLESPPQQDLDSQQVRDVLTEAGFMFPEAAKQTVYVLVEEPPQSRKVAGVSVAAPAVALEDYRVSNSRLFTYRLQYDDRFADFAEAHVPAAVERHLQQ